MEVHSKDLFRKISFIKEFIKMRWEICSKSFNMKQIPSLMGTLRKEECLGL